MNNQTAENQQTLIHELEALLQKQLLAIRQGNLPDAESLSRQSEKLVAQIAKTSNPAMVGLEYDRLAQLYKHIELSIESQKDITNRQLMKVQTGRTIIRTYRNKN